MKMTKRELALEQIKVEVAIAGRVTQKAIDIYVSNRISKAAFDAATRRGLAGYIARGFEPGAWIEYTTTWMDGNGYTSTYQIEDRDGELFAAQGTRVTRYKGQPDKISSENAVPLSSLRLEKFEVVR